MLPIVYREAPSHVEPQIVQKNLYLKGLNWWVSHCLALRGVDSVDVGLGNYRLEHYGTLKGIHHVANKIAEGILNKDKFVVVADYDCDGATACAVAVSGLRAFGADIDFVVPNRFIHGYGLTPSVVEMVVPMKPRWIVTVDNGTASNAGIDAANDVGIGVLVTDHHLPGEILPNAEGIVNPNQPNCPFPSKNLAGVGVMYYVLAAVRDALKEKNALPNPAPNLAEWLDLVALGTIADVVKLDENNRWLVRQGLQRIRAGFARPGIKALFEVAGKDWRLATSQDFGFGLGPRINAVGRLDDMTHGIRCLLSETDEEAREFAFRLDEYNKERKAIESKMKEIAWEDVDVSSQNKQFTRVAFSSSFHEGVVGIVAGRIKEKENTPVVVFARAQEEGYIKGSGRSITGLHLRDALDLVHKRGNNLFYKFGGHAMAAGLTFKEDRLEEFKVLFEDAVKEMMDDKLSQKYLLVDGELPEVAFTISTVESFLNEVWGQGFEAPLFFGRFEVLESKLMGKEDKKLHLKMKVKFGSTILEAVQFFNTEIPQQKYINMAYRLSINDFGGSSSVQLLVEDKEV